MHRMHSRLGFFVLTAASMALLFAGCAYTRRQHAEHTEHLLSAAGFKLKLADTPDRLARIQAMPQRTLRPVRRQGKVYWVYPDVQGCTCMYLGTQEAYQQYRDLVVQQRMAQEEREAAEVDEDAAIIDDDAVWESWGFDVW
jgi:hypothetical protein